MEQLHNAITGVIVSFLERKEISVAETILMLEIIKSDLVNQVRNGVYTKKPVSLADLQEVPKKQESK